MNTLNKMLNASLIILGATALVAAEAKTDPGEKSPSYYLYYGDKIKLLPLADKGYQAAAVKIQKNGFAYPRPCPEATFAASVKADGKTGAEYEKTGVEVLEESGVERDAFVRFGLPLPVSALFDLNKIRVTDAEGKPVAAQISATAFWKNSSVKWVLIQFKAHLKANERKNFNVEFGEKIAATAIKSPLKANVTENEITVDTGLMQAVIDKKKFNIFKEVRIDKNGDGKYSEDEKVASFTANGMELRDENKNLYASAFSAPSEWAVEESGPEKIVIRAKGEYADKSGLKKLMSYQARLTFAKNSSAATVSWTHINTNTANEFTDISSINAKLSMTWKIKSVEAVLDDSKKSGITEKIPATFSQWDDLNLSVNDKKSKSVLSGTFELSMDNGSKTGVSLRKCWQRWPKSFSAADSVFDIGILPEQPDKQFGRNLPYYLQFPFCEGKYRMKWGMSFTEDITIDFGGKLSAKQLDAETNMPVVAVIPAEWYAKTDALSGKMPMPNGKQFSLWFAGIEESFREHMELKKQQREYGFFNYGDSFGERGRNWTNNEYDFAHGLFMHYACTGNRDYYRWAMEAASHQADVDTVHAYPDAYYVGANHQHSIGHTGNWSQHHIRAEWTHLYDSHTSAENGHTWLNGLIDAWALAGHARAMNSAYMTAEHITWAMAPEFKRLGSHERSAGWPLIAISSIYNLTNDKEYLNAASKFASVAISEQKFDNGGAWPHILPQDHAKGSKTCVGNCIFLVGIVLNGMSAYHAASDDPQAAKSLAAGTDWLLKTFDPSKAGWPYSASPDGKPYYAPAAGLNNIITPALAYYGAIENDKDKMKVSELAFLGKYLSGPGANGKSLAFSLEFACDIMAGIQKYAMAHSADKGASYMAGQEGIVDFMKTLTTKTSLNNRCPANKIISVALTAEQATVKCHAGTHGSKPKECEKGLLKIVPLNSGDPVATASFDPRKDFDAEYKLVGKPGDIFNIMISDDQSLIWSFETDGANCFARLVRGFSIGAIGISKYYFTVPQNSPSFRFEAEGLHDGEYGAAIFRPDGSLAAIRTGSSGIVKLPWAENKSVPAKKGRIVLEEKKPQPGVWSVMAWASGDMSMQLNGVPPYISTEKTALPEKLFNVK